MLSVTLQLPEGTPRAVFLSGMNGPEVNEVVSAYMYDSGMPSFLTIISEASEIFIASGIKDDGWRFAISSGTQDQGLKGHVSKCHEHLASSTQKLLETC